MELKYTSTIDNSGRLVISKKLLHKLGWEGVVPVNITSDGETVLVTLQKEALICSACKKEVKSNFDYCPYCGQKLGGK